MLSNFFLRRWKKLIFGENKSLIIFNILWKMSNRSSCYRKFRVFDQTKKDFWDLHLQSARNEQYKVPYFSIFKLKNLRKSMSSRYINSLLD